MKNARCAADDGEVCESSHISEAIDQLGNSSPCLFHHSTLFVGNSLILE